DLDGGQPGAAGGAQYDERLSAFEFPALAQCVERRPIGHGEPRRALEVELVGYLHEPCRLDGKAFARRAVAGGAHHAVADGDRRHAGTDTLDRPGKFRRRRKWKRRFVLIFAGDDQQIEKIKRRGLDPHDGLAGTGNGFRKVCDLKFVGGAKVRAKDGFHGGPVVMTRGRRAHEFITTKQARIGSRCLGSRCWEAGAGPARRRGAPGARHFAAGGRCVFWATAKLPISFPPLAKWVNVEGLGFHASALSRGPMHIRWTLVPALLIAAALAAPALAQQPETPESGTPEAPPPKKPPKPKSAPTPKPAAAAAPAAADGAKPTPLRPYGDWGA